MNRRGFLRALAGLALAPVVAKLPLPAPTKTFKFADPKFIGKSYVLEDQTLYVKREEYMLEFFAYETVGGSIGHTSELAKVTFA